MKHSAAEWAAATVVPGPGEGTLARLGPVVLLVGSTDPEVVRPYVDHAATVAANGGQGRQLVRGFALMLSTATEESPGFAALAPHSTGLAVFVDGDVTVTVDGQQVTGADSLAWVERLIPWPVDTVSITLAGATAPAAGSPYRLDAGVVPAASVSVLEGATEPAAVPVAEEPSVEPVADPAAETGSHPAVGPLDDSVSSRLSEVEETGAVQAAPPTPQAPASPLPTEPPAPGPSPAAPEAAPEPAPSPAAAPVAGRPLPPAPADEHVQFQSVLIDDLEDDDFEPLPIVDDPSQLVDASSPREEVRGVYCKNRHFNDPRQLFCAVCGINMVQQTPVLVNGPRPPLGVVVLDDGSVFQLDRPYLLGRDPDADERVLHGDFRSLPIIDRSNQVSRVHARLELRGWDVVLVDNNSTNGTFVHLPRTPDWVRMPSGAEQVLVQGTRVRIGHRTLAFNTHAGSSA